MDCRATNCEEEVYARSLCTGHYQRLMRIGDIQEHIPLRKKTGMRKHPEYSTWSRIKQRCFDQNDKSYKNYGGRGITMHPTWVTDPAAFIAWIEENLGPRPEGMSIDRIDNDKNYEPGNLRWATRKQQNNNQRVHPNKTGFPGVTKLHYGRYQARISSDGTTIDLGIYDTAEEAAVAYQQAKRTMNDTTTEGEDQWQGS